MRWEDGAQGYANLWKQATIKASEATKVSKAAARVLAGRSRYDAVEAATGVPWWWVGVVHLLESNCDFTTHLHNGDPLTARTVHVPADRPSEGQPPFTWQASAIDALTLKGLDDEKDWSIPKALWNFERYNGFGYVSKGVNSPYVWSKTNLYSRGKYISDGVFDASAVSSQVGAAAILLAMGIGKTQMSLKNFETIIASAAPSAASVLGGPLAAFALRELAVIVGVAVDGNGVETRVAEALGGLTVGKLLETLTAWDTVVAPLMTVAAPAAPAAPVAAPAAPAAAPAAPVAAPAAPAAPAAAPAAPAAPAAASSLLDTLLPSLTGWKTAIGIAVYVVAHVADGFHVAPGFLTPDVLGIIDTLAGGIVGVGVIAKIDRFLSLFKK
jgi:lysozyme family protein